MCSVILKPVSPHIPVFLCRFYRSFSSCLPTLLIPALFILHWLFAVEEAGVEAITDEETKVYKLLSDLLIEADPEQQTDARPMSQRFMAVKAYQYKGGVQVWGVTTPLSRLCDGVAMNLENRVVVDTEMPLSV